MLKSPLTVVEYFHNMVKIIIETILKEGVFGNLLYYYYKLIEYQERGTLHTHLIVFPLILLLLILADVAITLDQKYYLFRIDVRKGEAEFHIPIMAFKLHFSD